MHVKAYVDRKINFKSYHEALKWFHRNKILYFVSEECTNTSTLILFYKKLRLFCVFYALDTPIVVKVSSHDDYVVRKADDAILSTNMYMLVLLLILKSMSILFLLDNG